MEDNCDALGSRYELAGEMKFTGTIGDIGTSSFYPPHHMTMGEGGAVYTDNPLLNKIIRSFRDWGRDCVCPSGCDNLCGHRFDRQYGELPLGYDASGLPQERSVSSIGALADACVRALYEEVK